MNLNRIRDRIKKRSFIRLKILFKALTKEFMFFTRVLKSIFDNYKTTLSEDDYQSFEIHVNNLMKNYIQDFSRFTPGSERGRYLHQLIEKEILASSHIETSCNKGCAACCHLEVEITDDDAAVLHNAIQDGITIDKNRLESLAERARLDPEWKKGVVSSNRCLFLGEDNACTIYSYRPSTCRKAAVVGHPKECSEPQGNSIPRIMPMAEIILSAALNLSNNSFGSLPKQLLNKLKLEEKITNTNMASIIEVIVALE